MQRRTFIRYSLATLVALYYPKRLYASFPESNTYPKVVVNIILDGGPDFRHLFVPKPDNDANSYASCFWKARISLYETQSNEADTLLQYKAVYDEYYDDITMDSQTFGILKECQWLKEQMEASRVALINNLIGSSNRDHSHSVMMLESGRLDIGPHDAGADGWLGRAAAQINSNVVSLSRNVRMICNGPHPSGDINQHQNDHVISAADTRNIALYDHETEKLIADQDSSYKYDSRVVLGRALESYYKAKASAISSHSIYRKFFNHEASIRAFGAEVKKILNENLPRPLVFDSSSSSYIGADNASANSSDRFVQQIAGLYDAFACRNIFDMRFASLEYTGWDSHKYQHDYIGPKFRYLFGKQKSLDHFYKEMSNVAPAALENTIFIFSGEFGRQLKANGGDGTDHGRGNSIIVLGKPVNGGIYGELFPTSELEIDVQSGKNLFETINSDIEGKTDLFYVLGRVLDWQEEGLGESVFGNLSQSIVEKDLDLANLLKP